MTDSADLPPLQYAILELVAARYRLGEHAWSVDTKCRRAVDALRQAGLVTVRDAPVERTLMVGLTEAGRDATLSPTYRGPVQDAEDRGARRALLTAVDEVKRVRVDGLREDEDYGPSSRSFEDWLRGRAADL